MGWNYRIVEDENGWLSLREVYYNKKGKPDRWTVDRVALYAENMQEFVYMNYLMQKAFNKPILKIAGNKLVEK